MSRYLVTAAFLLSIGIAVPLPVVADDPVPEYEMTQYQFVLLHRASPAPRMGGREIQRTQEAHVAYFTELARQGKLLIEGPLSRAGALAGALVLDVPTSDEARAVLEKDPWVRAGKYELEIHPWWAAKGLLTPPTDLQDQTWCYLGLLRRPADAPELTDERLAELQKGHLANIRAMADAGELLIAGPMGDDAVLRGILLFRENDPGKISEMVARDPSIRANRLAVEVHPWRVPSGTLPTGLSR